MYRRVLPSKISAYFQDSGTTPKRQDRTFFVRLASSLVTLGSLPPSLSSAREALLPQDDRLTELNRSLIPRVTRESTGWPGGILAKDVVLAIHKATSLLCIPMRGYRSAGCFCWTSVFEAPPTKTKFSLKVNDMVFEVLITERTSPDKPKGKGKGKSSKGKRSISPPASVALSSSSATIQEERIDRLEAKVGALEKKRDALDNKIDSHYNGLSNQLRQVLQHLQPRAHEPSGDTPPPKLPRQA